MISDLPSPTSSGRNPEQTLTQNKNRSTSALSELASGNCANGRWDATQGGGQYFKEKKKDMRRPDRALEFWDRLAKARKIPGNCGRCGKPNINGKKQCKKCLSYQAQYRKRKLLEKGIEGRGITSSGNMQLMKRIASLEMTVARLQLEIGMRRKAYRYVMRREKILKEKNAKPTGQPWFEDLPCMSFQEASAISHIYKGKSND